MDNETTDFPFAANASVAVIIPTYNGSRFIRETLHSVESQVRKPNRIVVVDDCSNDDTVETVKKESKRLSIPVEVIKRATPSGSPSRPINEGVSHCNEQFICVVDQDDLIDPLKLKSEIAALSRYNSASLAFGLCKNLAREDAHIQSSDILKKLHHESHPEGSEHEIIFTGNRMIGLLLQLGCFPIGFPGFTFRRSAWETCGGVDESMAIADHDFLCRLSLRGDAIFTKRLAYHRRIHDRNLSEEHKDKEWLYVATVRRYHQYACLDQHESESLATLIKAYSEKFLDQRMLLRSKTAWQTYQSISITRKHRFPRIAWNARVLKSFLIR